MAKLSQQELRGVLEKRLQEAGQSELYILAKLAAFDEAWAGAHPNPWASGEFHTGHLGVRYLCFPGCYSGAETDVLEFFGLLDQMQDPNLVSK